MPDEKIGELIRLAVAAEHRRTIGVCHDAVLEIAQKVCLQCEGEFDDLLDDWGDIIAGKEDPNA